MKLPMETADLRRGNAARIMEQLDQHAWLSRVELAQLTGLVGGTITNIVGELLRLQVVTDQGHESQVAGRGRPRRQLQANFAHFAVAALIVTPEASYVEICDLQGATRYREVLAQPTSLTTAQDLQDLIKRLIKVTLSALSRLADLHLLEICIGVPGPISADGTLIMSVDLQLGRVELSETCSAARASSIPIRIFNDAKLAALGDFSALEGEQKKQTIAFVSAGIGVSGGLIKDGRLVDGAYGFSGEIGHLIIDAQGPRCGCGGRGCLMQYLGAKALAQRSNKTPVLSSEGVPGLITSLKADQGSGEIRQALDQAGRALGVAVANVSAWNGTQAVVLGGSLAQLWPKLSPSALPIIQARQRQLPDSVPQVFCSELGERSIVAGAVYLAKTRLIDDPLAAVSGIGQDEIAVVSGGE